jgi:hypothetical protein
MLRVRERQAFLTLEWASGRSNDFPGGVDWDDVAERSHARV